MKMYALFLFLGCLVASGCLAEIKNGYSEVAGARSSLICIRKLLEENKGLSHLERQNMKHKRDDLERYIIHYAFTERLLAIFRAISPELYAEMDTLKDSRGRRVDVYVKFVPETDLPRGVAGITSLDQDKADEHTCQSEYGPNSVSVIIVAGNKSLAILAHELGHVQYQTMNLASYVKYYSTSYGNSTSSRKSFGHNDRDDSGRKAVDFVGRFQEHFISYIRQGQEKQQSHQTLIQSIEREVKNKGGD